MLPLNNLHCTVHSELLELWHYFFFFFCLSFHSVSHGHYNPFFHLPKKITITAASNARALNLPLVSPAPNWNPPTEINQPVSQGFRSKYSHLSICAHLLVLGKKIDVMDRLLEWLLIRCVEPSLPPPHSSLSLSLPFAHTHTHTPIIDHQQSASLMCDWQLVMVFPAVWLYFYDLSTP